MKRATGSHRCEQPLSGRRLDWFSLTLGATFMVLAVCFVADQANWMRLDLAFVGPLLLIAFGIGSVFNGFRKNKHDERP
jgi:hypothetical protein